MAAAVVTDATGVAAARAGGVVPAVLAVRAGAARAGPEVDAALAEAGVVPVVAAVVDAVRVEPAVGPDPQGGHADAVSQARQAPQAAPRTPRWRLARAGQGPVRRVWPEGARGGLAHQ